MEVTSHPGVIAPFAIDASHPNAVRWQRAVDRALDRGALVVDVLARHFDLPGKKICDLGCGIGGTSRALAHAGATVIPVDAARERLVRAKSEHRLERSVNGEATALSFRDASFDAVLLQDVIEHSAAGSRLLSEAARVLKPDGILFLTTPNRFSIINVIADPHWGLPLVALMPRRVVGFVVHALLRREKRRDDFAALHSLSSLLRLFRQYRFDPQLHQRFVADQLLDHPERIIWSDLHRFVFRMLSSLKLLKQLTKLVNDRPGFINRVVSPSWFFIARKEA